MALSGSTIPYIPPAATQQQQIAAINRVIDIINSFQQSITFSDDQNKRMIIGYQKDGWGQGKSFGMKISIPGVDVTQASSTQLLFSWDYTTGTQVFYKDGVALSQINSDGITIKDKQNNRARFGYNPQGTRVNVWATPEGKDVLTLLESET